MIASRTLHRPLFWLLVVPLVAALAWLGLLLAQGTTSPLEVTVGRSMEPTLSTGDLAVMRGVAPADIQLGDIVAIDVNEGDRKQYGYPEHVLHRVIDITLNDGALIVQTKGDNEVEPDPFSTPASKITRRYHTSVPLLGHVLFYLRSMQGRIALGGVFALLLLYEAVRWMTDTAEELMEEPEEYDGFTSGVSQLAGAMADYGEHLRSHTRVVQELGGTTEELHSAAAMQQQVLRDLSYAVNALAAGVGGVPVSAVPWAPERSGLPPASADAAALAAAARGRMPDRVIESTVYERPRRIAAWGMADDAPSAHDASVPADVVMQYDDAAGLFPVGGIHIEAVFREVALLISGLPSQGALLQFGALLEDAVAPARVALVSIEADGARFTVESVDARLLARTLRDLCGPDADAARRELPRPQHS